MNKEALNIAVDSHKQEVKEALLTVYNALNQGQQKKILKNDNVKALFKIFEVLSEEGTK